MYSSSDEVPSSSESVPGKRADRSGVAQTWGLGDVAGGVLAAQFLAVLVVTVVYGVAGWTSSDDVPIWATGILQVPLWVGLAGAVWYAAERKGGGLAHDFGLTARILDAPLGLAIGVACQLVLLPMLYWPLLLLLGKTGSDLSEPAEKLAGRAQGTFGWIVLAVMVVVAAPFVEELFYRGLLLRSLTKKGWAPWAAVLCSAAVFGAMHFQPLQFVGLFAFGLVLGTLAQTYGRLGPSMWAHAGFNATTVVSLYLSTH